MVLLDRPNGHYWETWRRFVVNDLLEQGLISPTDLSLFKITHSLEDTIREAVTSTTIFTPTAGSRRGW